MTTPKPKKEKAPKKTVDPDFAQKFFDNLVAGFATDRDLETKDGVAIDFGRFGTFVILRAIGRNGEYSKAVRETVIPFAESTAAMVDPDAETIASNDRESAKLMAKVYADTVIIGIKDKDGNSIPYNAEAKKMMADVLIKSPDLFTRLQAEANDQNNFKKKIETEAKN